MTENTEIHGINADEALIEDIRADREINDADQLARLLVGWRKEIQEG